MKPETYRVPGFLAHGIHTGIKANGCLDLALIFSTRPAKAAGVFTTNCFKAAPVLLDMERIRTGFAQAIIANSGVANAATGAEGFADALSVSRAASRRLGIEDDLVLVVPSRHRWASKKEVAAHELADEPFISREVGSGTLSSLENYLQHAGVKGIGSLRVIARLGTSTAVKEGVKAGAGVSILSSRAVETELKAGVLTSLKIKGLPMSRHFYLIRDRRRTISPLCRTLLDFLIAAPNQPEKVKAPSPPRAPRVRAR